MVTESYREGQKEQEKACANTFLSWLSSQYNASYELHRADEKPEIKGRWDFVANEIGRKNWLAIEVKGLVIPHVRRQFNSWCKFCDALTKELHTQQILLGSFVITTGVPWIFNQRQSKLLKSALLDVLVNICPGDYLDSVNIGSKIASLFPDWPTKPPTIDNQLSKTQHVYKIIHPPEDIFISKLDNIKTSIECIPLSQVYRPHDELIRAILRIFNPEEGKGAKPNIQLYEARDKGALETILLLDSHIKWQPNIVAKLLVNIDQSLFSSIDSIYLISCNNNLVRKVWPLS